MDIKAKKISQLSNIDINTQKQRYLNSYFVIAYNNGIDDKANYKVKISDFLESAYSGSIDESVLDDYAKSAYVDNNYMSKASWNNYYTYIMNTIAENMCDCDHTADMTAVWDAIREIKDLIKYYHSNTTINIRTEYCTVSGETDKDTDISDKIHRYIINMPINEDAEITLVPDRGYKFQNTDVQCIGCDFTFNPETGKLILSNLSESDVNITIIAISKSFNVIYNIDENAVIRTSKNPVGMCEVSGWIKDDAAIPSATFEYNPSDYKVKSIKVTNANYDTRFSDAELGIFYLQFKPSGTGNITVTFELEALQYYYFGFTDTEDIFELAYTENNDSYPVGLLNVQSLYNANNDVPWPVNEQLTIISRGENNYRYMIIPKIMFSIEDTIANNGSAILVNPKTNKLYTIVNNTGYPVTVNEPYLFDNIDHGDIYNIGIYENIEYYAIQMVNSADEYKISEK